jgi:predicted ATPase
MKICKIYIKGYQQFQDVILDFTHPETGEPLDKICLIGSNGTGKSTLLRLIDGIVDLLKYKEGPLFDFMSSESPMLALVFKSNTKKYYFFNDAFSAANYFFSSKLDYDLIDDKGFRNFAFLKEWLDFFKNLEANSSLTDEKEFFIKSLEDTPFFELFSTHEGETNGYSTIEDVPKTNVNEAIKLFNNLPSDAIISPDTINDFWKLLVFNLKKREDDRRIFEETEENMQRIKADLVTEFNGKNPNVLEELAAIWDKILDKAGLFLNYKVAKSPVQLHENLHAYICLKGTNKVVPYNQLSSGIRDYIFRVGHIFAMYFNREVDRGILLVDEPDNSLFPDFVIDLLDTYKQITTDKRGENHTQMIFATHNPLFAAQFEPYERIILNWNEDGSVSASKGISPIGDDPNDLLTEDFGLINLMSAEGQKMWEKYIELKKKLIRSKDMSEKEQLVEEINQIATLYKFNLYEIPVEK